MRKEYRIRNDLQMHELAKYIGLEKALQSWNIAFENIKFLCLVLHIKGCEKNGNNI